MSSSQPTQSVLPRADILYQTPHLTAFEHTIPDHPVDGALNILIFIPGLTDTPLHPTYPQLHLLPFLSDPNRFAPSPPTNRYTLVQPLLSSSGSGWGSSSLTQDVVEISLLIDYLRTLPRFASPASKIVLMGHSTGCQDVMHYLTSTGHNTRPQISAAILQAPVSDREAMTKLMRPDILKAGIRLAQEWTTAGMQKDVLPRATLSGFFDSPVSAERFLSLALPGGKDDYFSLDIADKQLNATFGLVARKHMPLLILESGADEYVPDPAQKKVLLQKWQEVIHANRGKCVTSVIEGASHNMMGDPQRVMEHLVKTVGSFLCGLQ